MHTSGSSAVAMKVDLDEELVHGGEHIRHAFQQHLPAWWPEEILSATPHLATQQQGKGILVRHGHEAVRRTKR